MADSPPVAGILQVIRSVDPALPVGLQVSVPLEGGVVGRSADADVCLPGSTVSRRHARLELADGRWNLRPLTDSNSVFVDGEPIADTTALEVGAAFQLGGVVCRFVADPGTSPVLVRLDLPVLLEVHDDGGQCTVHAGGALLPLASQEARVLGELVDAVGRPVHRWDLQEVIGGSANLDQVVSRLRAGLRSAIEGGLIPRDDLALALGVEGGPDALVKGLVVTRRGHGYLLALPAHQVRRVRA